MTILTDVIQGWGDPVSEIRIPYWLTKDDRAILAESIVDLIHSTTVFPTMRDHLDAVLTELGVAEARDQVWPTKTNIVRRAYGYSADVLPIRMSETERQMILSIPTLPKALYNKLAGALEKK